MHLVRRESELDVSSLPPAGASLMINSVWLAQCMQSTTIDCIGGRTSVVLISYDSNVAPMCCQKSDRP